jgi:hypothetical protein
MKPFLLRLSLFAAIQLLVAGFVVWRGNPRNENHWYLSMRDKIERMEQSTKSRLLLVGGSNLAFGIDCELLEETGLTPVNLGLNAGLGLDLYLRIVEDRVREGDIIVLSPEYELFTVDPPPSMQREFIRVCPELAHYLDVPADPGESWKYMLDQQALAVARAWVRKAFISTFTKQPEEGGGIYSRTSFNCHGDITTHRNLPPLGKIEATLVAFDPVRVREMIERLNAFAEHCQSRGAEVYYSYPPMPKDRFAVAHPTVTLFQRMLSEELRVAQIDQPTDQLYENDQFFDTNYHLNGKAAADRTTGLLESLETCRLAKGSSPLRTATTGETRRN